MNYYGDNRFDTITLWEIPEASDSFFYLINIPNVDRIHNVPRYGYKIRITIYYKIMYKYIKSHAHKFLSAANM